MYFKFENTLSPMFFMFGNTLFPSSFKIENFRFRKLNLENYEDVSLAFISSSSEMVSGASLRSRKCERLNLLSNSNLFIEAVVLQAPQVSLELR